MSRVEPSSVTVIVETYNLTESTGASALVRAAGAAVDQAREVGGHVLVAAAGPVAAEVEPVLEGLGPELRILPCDPASYDALKQRAAEAATTPFIAYLDSDCEPAPGWLRAHLAALEDGAVASAGVTYYRGGWLAKVLSVLDFGFLQDAPVDAAGCYSSNNVAFDRTAFLSSPPEGTLRCNCFSHAQDLLRQGTPVRMVRQAVVVHDLPPFVAERLRRGADLVEAVRDDPERPEAWLLRLGLGAAPLFYLRALQLDLVRLLVGRRRIGFSVQGAATAVVTMPVLRLVDLAGIISALRAHRPLDHQRRRRRAVRSQAGETTQGCSA